MHVYVKHNRRIPISQCEKAPNESHFEAHVMWPVLPRHAASPTVQVFRPRRWQRVGRNSILRDP